MFWAVGTFAGLTMNIGNASLADKAAGEAPKLEAMWQAPSLGFGGTAFYGGFDLYDVSGASSIGQFLLKCWVYSVYGLVAALVISYFYCANTIIYLLLRREVDATDIEDVYLEDLSDEPAPPPTSEAKGPQPNASGGTSLPVIG
jgi:hypothetical protein